MATLTSMVLGFALVLITFGIMWFINVVIAIVVKNQNEIRSQALTNALHALAEKEIEKHKKDGTWSL